MSAYARYVIIGAGIHGLSTAWNLAEGLKASGKGSGEDILVLDKAGVAAGASGIACGVVRNNYFQPAMRKRSVIIPSVTCRSAPKACAKMSQPSTNSKKPLVMTPPYIEGAEDTATYMKNILSDWQATGVTSVLHEKRGGYANNAAAIYGLATKAENLGVRVMSGITVTGFVMDNGSDAVKSVETDKGTRNQTVTSPFHVQHAQLELQ